MTSTSTPSSNHVESHGRDDPSNMKKAPPSASTKLPSNMKKAPPPPSAAAAAATKVPLNMMKAPPPPSAAAAKVPLNTMKAPPSATTAKIPLNMKKAPPAATTASVAWASSVSSEKGKARSSQGQGSGSGKRIVERTSRYRNQKKKSKTTNPSNGSSLGSSRPVAATGSKTFISSTSTTSLSPPATGGDGQSLLQLQGSTTPKIEHRPFFTDFFMKSFFSGNKDDRLHDNNRHQGQTGDDNNDNNSVVRAPPSMSKMDQKISMLNAVNYFGRVKNLASAQRRNSLMISGYEFMSPDHVASPSLPRSPFNASGRWEPTPLAALMSYMVKSPPPPLSSSFETTLQEKKAEFGKLEGKLNFCEDMERIELMKVAFWKSRCLLQFPCGKYRGYLSYPGWKKTGWMSQKTKIYNWMNQTAEDYVDISNVEMVAKGVLDFLTDYHQPKEKIHDGADNMEEEQGRNRNRKRARDYDENEDDDDSLH